MGKKEKKVGIDETSGLPEGSIINNNSTWQPKPPPYKAALSSKSNYMKTKNKLEEVLEEKVDSGLVPEVVPVSEVKITPFTGDFSRVDFNSLRDKVNEIIAFINK